MKFGVGFFIALLSYQLSFSEFHESPRRPTDFTWHMTLGPQTLPPAACDEPLYAHEIKSILRRHTKLAGHVPSPTFLHFSQDFLRDHIATLVTQTRQPVEYDKVVRQLQNESQGFQNPLQIFLLTSLRSALAKNKILGPDGLNRPGLPEVVGILGYQLDFENNRAFAWARSFPPSSGPEPADTFYEIDLSSGQIHWRLTTAHVSAFIVQKNHLIIATWEQGRGRNSSESIATYNLQAANSIPAPNSFQFREFTGTKSGRDRIISLEATNNPLEFYGTRAVVNPVEVGFREVIQLVEPKQ
jgi:hypothetical protein